MDFNQITTAFHTGATCVLMNHLLPRDVINTVVEANISGLAAVPAIVDAASSIKMA